MKITDMKVHMMQVPLVRPFRISLGVITHAVSCLVEIETDAGITLSLIHISIRTLWILQMSILYRLMNCRERSGRSAACRLI